MEVSSDITNNKTKAKKKVKVKKSSTRKKSNAAAAQQAEENVIAPWKGMSTKGWQRKHDYDSDDLYDEMYYLAFNGATDSEIACALNLSETAFSLMKNGKYDKWSAEENERRGSRMVKVLARARKQILRAIRGKYLQAALGGQEIENVTTVTRHLRIDGQITDNEEVQVSTTRTKTLPNMQALSTLLFHYDADWRKVQRGADEESSDIPQEIESGIDVAKWIEQEVSRKNE
ncbi:MAG: hypothetical protein IJS13_06910 [Paludibacteraceae bacterium]|nr:hypothetical protein [Paludibacteraceae bacterium]